MAERVKCDGDVGTTMCVGISAKLPETSPIKMKDLWLILSLLTPFHDIIIQTYIESVHKV